MFRPPGRGGAVREAPPRVGQISTAASATQPDTRTAALAATHVDPVPDGRPMVASALGRRRKFGNRILLIAQDGIFQIGAWTGGAAGHRRLSGIRCSTTLCKDYVQGSPLHRAISH